MSDFCAFTDVSFYSHSSPEMVSSDADFQFSDIFSSFSDSTTEIPHTMSISVLNNQNNHNPVDESPCFDQVASSLLSCSPPIHQLDNLSLYQNTHFHQLPNSSILADGYQNFSGISDLEVKNEEYQVGLELGSAYNYPFGPHSYSGVENVAKFMQRSFSSNSFEKKPDFLLPTHLDSLMASPNFHNQTLSSPEDTLFTSRTRRVSSTGDLQNIRAAQTSTNQRSFSSPLATESSFMEATNFKVGRYSAEERQERISKYRAKRNLRNFNKTIKYACRKTLADNRPRVRGRFARNDDTFEIPKAPCSAREEDEFDFWIDGLHEEEEVENGTVRGGGAFGRSFGQQQFQYYGCL